MPIRYAPLNSEDSWEHRAAFGEILPVLAQVCRTIISRGGRRYGTRKRVFAGRGGRRGWGKRAAPFLSK